MASKKSYVAPQCITLALCDTVIEDVKTRNKSLINLFNGILAASVPVRHDKMCAFASFSGGRGSVPLKLRLWHDQDFDHPVLEMGGTVSFPDHLAVIDLVFEVRGLTLPKFGNYIVDIVVDGVPIISRRFNVTELKKENING